MRHLPEYGREASAAERSQAQAALSAYLRAVSEGGWRKACGYVAAQLRAQVEETAAQNGQPAGGCGRALRWYSKMAAGSTAEFRDFAKARIGSLRTEGDSGFALLHGPGGKGYWVAMKRQEGGWRILTLVPQPLG